MSTRLSRPLRAASVALAVSLLPATARAAPPKAAPVVEAPAADDSPAARSVKLRAQANQTMLEMHYRDALALYEQARELAPGDVTLLYSVGRAYELLGDFPRALDALERFSREAPPEVKAKVGDIASLQKQLARRVSTLALTCNVEGARVLLGDRVIGTTPLPANLRLPAGAATLQVELDGFFTRASEVVLPADGKLALEVTLLRKSQSGTLTISTEPLGAAVFVDGRLAGTSSPKLEVVLPAGEHRLLAQREGFDDAQVPLVIAPASTRDVSLVLSKSVPLTSRWWFWTGLGAVVVGGTVLTVAALTEKSPKQGTLAPGQVAAPLLRF